jgi:hypothetical protein
MKKNRILICLSGGVISACICLVGSQVIFGFPEITWSTVSTTIANRLLLGFVIGISSWDIKHHLHGALLGLILSLTVSIGFLPGEILKFFLYTGAGIFYGIMIDWLATDIFKAGKKQEI